MQVHKIKKNKFAITFQNTNSTSFSHKEFEINFNFLIFENLLVALFRSRKQRKFYFSLADIIFIVANACVPS